METRRKKQTIAFSPQSHALGMSILDSVQSMIRLGLQGTDLNVFNMKTQQEDLTVYLTANELASRWKMHPESLRRMARQRRLETIIVAGRRLFPMSGVERVEAEGHIARTV